MGFPRVVIIGGGFAGLAAARALAKTKVDILLIDRTNHHLFQPLLYEVAAAALSPEDIATPIRKILKKQANATVMMGEVVSIDKEKKSLSMKAGGSISYDYLIVSPGARHSYFGNEAWEEFAPGLKTVQDALNIREQILSSFEKAERLDSISESGKFLNFVIIGGGPTGVEMAGAIAEIAHKSLFKNFRRIRPEKSKIYLIEAMPYILPTYPKRLSRKAESDLAAMGVRVITRKKVSAITSEGVQIEDEFIEAKNVIWAAGNQASPLLKTLNVPLDRAGRVKVERDLSVPGYPELFVIGDAACFVEKDGERPLPAVAPVAVQQGRFVASLIKQKKVRRRKTFSYVDKGSLVAIGTRKAVAAIKPIQLTGFIAWLAWCFVHIVYLIGFRNRLSVMIQWCLHFFSGQRGSRLILSSLDEEKDR